MALGKTFNNVVSVSRKYFQVTKEELGLYIILIKEKNPSHMEDKIGRKDIIQDTMMLAFDKEGMRCKDGPSSKSGPNMKEKGLHLKYLHLKEDQLLKGFQTYFMVVVTPATIMVTWLSTSKFMIAILQQETEVWVPSSFNIIIVRVLIILQKIVRNKD